MSDTGCRKANLIHGQIVPCTGGPASRYDTTHMCAFKEPTAPGGGTDLGPCDACGSTTAPRVADTIDQVDIVRCVEVRSCNRRAQGNADG
jgi:hypothetical protein